ncbi:peptidyl-prolyl cis-trans isomerase, chloroplastic [Raphidocelis subcapitata]|uniref:Peptidyl-prolyl cis-trans isomerase, chloroplastic n=1 Tax=Raphidocelis subcapitata TaxID=307507 RepID=A0A2V0NTP4_9CHLO|nr:peptidyl-prolyl cis-trans isomerase, chloroplastic [Raphidocelis subcapitata]|eukprot:GBF91011.1 peptidyl-prolyl cis-trans isomerase, chloroplastic [Raphidocelis subcapitata]
MRPLAQQHARSACSTAPPLRAARPQPLPRRGPAPQAAAAADGAAAPATAAAAEPPAPATRRRALALAAAAAALLPAVHAGAGEEAEADAGAGAPDTTITDTVFIEFGLADTAFKAPGERTLGDRSIIPPPKSELGRLEIGLYGKACPATTANFLALVRSGTLAGTVVSRISPGEYVQLARQGSRRMGEVELSEGLRPNTDISSPAGFKLTHGRPGTVSLSIASDNDEDPAVRDKPGYRPLEFLITTGPGPVPRLDGLNLVFGRVTSGMTTVAAVSKVPSFQPDARSQQLNAFAKFIGDDRADKVRRRYGRPLKAIVVTSAGVVGEAAAAPPTAAARAAARGAQLA